jgi:hypothetical protein
MDAWDGCIVAMKSSNKGEFLLSFENLYAYNLLANVLVPFMDSIFDLLRTIQQDSNRTEALLRSACGVIGYVQRARLSRIRLTSLVILPMPSPTATSGSTSVTTSLPRWRGRLARTRTSAAELAIPPAGHVSRSSVKLVSSRTVTSPHNITSTHLYELLHIQYILSLIITLQAATQASWPEHPNPLPILPATWGWSMIFL